MADSIAVFAARRRLPSTRALAGILSVQGYALKLNRSLDWKTVDGWLPVRWNDCETGCEIELSMPPRNRRSKLALAGLRDADTEVTLTARGDVQSWNVVYALAAAIAHLAKGSIAEGDEELIPFDHAFDWAKAGIASAREQIPPLPKRKGSGDGALSEADATLLRSLLQALHGSSATIEIAPHHLILRTPHGASVSSKAWRVMADGTVIDHTLLAHASMKEQRLMKSLENGLTSEQWMNGLFSPEQQRMLDSVQLEQTHAVAHEAVAAGSAGELVSQLDQPLVVESARYAGSGRIELQFQDPGAFRVEFFGIGMLFGLHVVLGGHRFELY